MYLVVFHLDNTDCANTASLLIGSLKIYCDKIFHLHKDKNQQAHRQFPGYG